MKYLPSRRSFEIIARAFPPRYQQFINNLFSGKSAGKAADECSIPRISAQVVCYRITKQFFGFEIPPARLQRLLLLRRLIDGDSVNELESMFGTSSIRNARATAFNCLSKNCKKMKISLDHKSFGSIKYRREQKQCIENNTESPAS